MDDVIKSLYALFDAAFEENVNGRGTDITRMVTTFVLDAIQELQAYRDNGLVLPHTIGNITYYSKEELIEWVEKQQNIFKELLVHEVNL